MAILPQYTGSDGHEYVYLEEDGVVTPAKVAELVLEAFVGPRPEGAVPVHLDGDKGNNAFTNLAWGQPPADDATIQG